MVTQHQPRGTACRTVGNPNTEFLELLGRGSSWVATHALLWYANYPNLGTAETYEPAKRVVRSRYGLPLAIPYLVMFTKGPLHVPITPGSVAGGVTWGLRNGFDVVPRGARAPRAWPRARPFPVTARFGHPLLEHRFLSHLYRTRSLGKLGERAHANFRRYIR